MKSLQELVAKLACRMKGHKRGRPIIGFINGVEAAMMRCPRCGATWEKGKRP